MFAHSLPLFVMLEQIHFWKAKTSTHNRHNPTTTRSCPVMSPCRRTYLTQIQWQHLDPCSVHGQSARVPPGERPWSLRRNTAQQKSNREIPQKFKCSKQPSIFWPFFSFKKSWVILVGTVIHRKDGSTFNNFSIHPFRLKHRTRVLEKFVLHTLHGS